MDRLPRAKGAQWDYVDRPACLEGTRIEELERMMNWMDDEGERRMYVLTGLAGIGKTTIAKSVAELAHGNRILGASFFCSRGSDERSNMRLIFPTIAFQLAHYSTEFRVEVLKAIKMEPDIGHSLPDKQLEELIVRPMRAVVSSLVASTKTRLGFCRSLSDRQLDNLILQPLRLIATSLETDPGFIQVLLDAQWVLVVPLQSVAMSFKDNGVRQAVVDEVVSIIETLRNELSIGRIQELIIRPIGKIVISMKEESARLLRETGSQELLEKLQSLTEDLRTIATSIATLVETRLGEEFGRTIVDPSQKILSSVQEQLDKGHILPDHKFHDQIFEPVRKLIASMQRQDISYSQSTKQFKEQTMKHLYRIISPLQEKLDISPWLSDTQLDQLILYPLRKAIETKNVGSCSIDEQLETWRGVVMELRATILLLEECRRKGRSLSHEEPGQSVTELIQKISYFSRPVIVVVDALDECRDLETPEKFLLALARHIHSTPFLKIFSTSRPEFSTRLALQNSSVDRLTDILILHQVDRARVDADIRLFFQVRLAAIATRQSGDNTKLPHEWPPEDLVNKLIGKAGGLFIFAFTICRFLESPGDIQDHLEFIANLHTSTEGRLGIDELYQKVIDAALSNFVDPILISQCGLVVAAIILLFDPLSLKDLAEVLNVKPGSIRGVLRDLHSVLVVPLDDKGIIHTFHASFHDFLTDQNRCSGQIYVHPAQRHMEITVCLLQRMLEGLERNICRLDGSRLNRDVKDLSGRMERYIGKPLAYACRYWAEHLSHVLPTESSETLKQMVDRLIRTKLLYWIEVLSLLGDMGTANMSLARVRKWFSVRRLHSTGHQYLQDPQTSPWPDLSNLLDDAHRFMIEFSKGIEDSALHVYNSALLFTPRSTTLFETFKHEFRTSVGLLSNRMMTWDSPSKTLKHHSATVTSNPMDSYFPAFREGIKGLRRLSTPTGKAHLSENPISAITSVAVCPNGTRFVTESQRKMRLWETNTGKRIASFNSLSGSLVKFSPDGTCFVSENESGLQLRDTITGSLLSTLDCRTVSLGDISSDGARLVSLFQHESQLLNPTIGRATATIDSDSVIFSPDGSRIVFEGFSGLYLYNSATGKLVVFLGYGDIQMVGFSPDSTRMVSPRRDGVQLWNAVSGQPLTVLACGPEAHFSPDGLHIICKSCNGLSFYNSADGLPVYELQPSSTANTPVTPQPKYDFQDNWVVGSFKSQQNWICWLPWNYRGNKPVFATGGNCFVLGNENGHWTIVNLSRVHWTN